MCVLKNIIKKLSIIFLFIVLYLINFSLAYNNDSINITLDVNGVPYFIVEPIIDDSIVAPLEEIDLYAANKTIVWCNATVDDPNGIFDLNKVSIKFYHEDMVLESVGYNYYENLTCPYNEFGETSCKIELNYYTKPGNWICEMNVSDAVGTYNISLANTQIKETLGLRIENETQLNIDFGMLSMGENTTNTDIPINITNIGNTNFDLMLNAWTNNIENDNDPYAMNCSYGAIPISSLRYSTTKGTNYDSKISFQETGFSFTPFNLLSQINSQRTYKEIFLGIGVPKNSAGGICTGNLKIVATK